MPRFPDTIFYSEKYEDNVYEYRHVLLTEPVFKAYIRLEGKLLEEREWRALGIQMKPGW